MKKCKTCQVDKEASDFYQHNISKDGLSLDCKDCSREKAKKRRNYEYAPKVNVSAKPKKWRKEVFATGKIYKKWQYELLTKASSEARRVVIPRHGMVNHHWSYKTENLTDIIEIPMFLHKKIHKYIAFNYENLCFKTCFGELLDTRQKHIDFISYTPELRQYLIKNNLQLI